MGPATTVNSWIYEFTLAGGDYFHNTAFQLELQVMVKPCVLGEGTNTLEFPTVLGLT